MKHTAINLRELNVTSLEVQTCNDVVKKPIYLLLEESVQKHVCSDT